MIDDSYSLKADDVLCKSWMKQIDISVNLCNVYLYVNKQKYPPKANTPVALIFQFDGDSVLLEEIKAKP